MILKDIMEEKQLNFNQPLLSVRRFSSTVASETDKTQPNLPAYKSELKSGPVRDAGKVPFVWEKTPGRPKDETKLHTQVVENPPIITPNLPPGRVSKVLKQQDSVTEMRTGSTLSRSQNVAALIREVTKHVSSLEEKIRDEKESSDSDDDGDETFLDALDTLSRTESFFMSSRMSGWDGDDDDEAVQVQPSGSFSSDRARDFIIDRFLPAAKAMTSETPQYSSRKTLAVQEQHKKKVVNTEKRSPPLNQHRPQSLRYYTQDIDREGSEDESDDCNGSENHTTTACGLFPRLCLLNPIPGSRMAVDKVQGNVGRGMQTKSTASHFETTKGHAKPPLYGKKSLDSRSDFRKEKEILGILGKSKHGTDPHLRDCSKLLACSESTQRETIYETPNVEKTLYVDSVQKVKSETNHRGSDFETLIGDSGIYQNPSIDSSLENSKRLDIANVKAASQPKSSEPLDSPILVCSKNSSNGMQMETENPSKKIDSEKQRMTKTGNHGSDLDQDLVMTSGVKSQGTAKSIDQEYTLVSSKVSDGEKIDLESQCVENLDNTSDDANYFEIPLVLPSLKAPSESWLKRTLPTISSRNIHSQSNLARSQTSKTESLYTKWETIVKSSNAHHQHLQLHEVLTPIPED